MKMEAQENAAQQEVVEHEQLPISDDVALISSFSSSPTNHQLMTIVMGSTAEDESNNNDNKCMDDDDDDDAIMMNHISDDADAALDSILETTVAEVNLALASHDDDATAAAAAAAATTAALDAAVTVVAEAMIDDPHHHDPLMMMQQQQLPLLQPPPLLLMDQQQQQQQQSDGSSSNSNKRSFDALTPDEKQADLVKNLNMNSTAAPSASELSWTMPVAAAVPAGQQQHHRVGRWSLDEKIMFLFGLQKFGKGRWKKISTYVPDRSVVVFAMLSFLCCLVIGFLSCCCMLGYEQENGG